MSWGTRIFIGMTIFIIFILTMGARMLLDKKDDLVEKDYYEKGQDYNTDYREQQNALNQARLPDVSEDHSGLSVRFPEKVAYSLVCRHPFDSDRDIYRSGEDSVVLIPRNRLAKGTWNLEITWTGAGLDQKFKKQIHIR